MYNVVLIWTYVGEVWSAIYLTILVKIIINMHNKCQNVYNYYGTVVSVASYASCITTNTG